MSDDVQAPSPVPAAIAGLNDRFRRLGGASGVPGRMFMTRGISALPHDVQLAIIRGVATFDAFTPDNDPYGEHDFGAIEVPQVGRVFWKVDYYADARLDAGSEAPEDPSRSFRVLTIMLASEY